MELSTQIPTQVLNHLLNNEEYCRRVIPYLKKEYFEGPHKITFDLIVDFVTTHNKIPSGKVLELELKKVQMPEDVLNNVSRLINEIKEKSDIDTEYLTSIYPKDSKCPALGISMWFSDADGVYPSVDRIDPKKGYIKGNVIWVSYKANRIKNDATVEELKKVTNFYSKL